MVVIIVLKNGFILRFCNAKGLLVSDVNLIVDNVYERYSTREDGFKSKCVETFDFPLDLIANWEVMYVSH